MKDLVGNEMTPAEKRLVRTLKAVETMLAEPDIAPCVAANVREAYAALWVAANDLGLVSGRPDGVPL